MDPTGILAVIPSLLNVGEKFEIKIKVLGPIIEIPSLSTYNNLKPRLRGQFNLNPSRQIQYRDNCLPEWKGVLELEGGPDFIGQKILCFDGKNQGVFPGDRRPIKAFGGLKWSSPGFHFLRLTDSVSGITVLSNPVYVSEKKTKRRIFWGDPHWQTFFSDGIRCPEELYAFARDEAFLDFGAISDHMEAVTDRQWDYFIAVTNDFNQEGKFVTLIGQEWTSHPEYGHRNIYYRGDNGPVLRSNDLNYDTLDKLWKGLEGIEAIVIPHHTSNKTMGVDWDYGYNHLYEKAVEIHSIWGSSECHKDDGNIMPIRTLGGEVKGRHVIDALKRGYRFGFVGGGDIHDGRPGDELHRYQLTYKESLLSPQGFTAAMTPSLTRENIYNAIKNRVTYATTKSRIYLKFAITKKDSAYGFDLKTASEDGIREAVLIHNGLVRMKLTPDDDPKIIIGSKKIGFLNPGDFCYVRIMTEKNNIAWSSPIWIGG